MKKVYCLYRVSTKRQVDKIKDDIPMQKIACQEFVKEKGWYISKEFYEKGVSGYKVSAEDRDAIQELREAAVKKEFDVLLVYMFDRLGRRDDETPFVVEWFVKQGIEVWSTQEGQQKFDDQVDKLLNYIRYWQASGESLKNSIRIKTRTVQLVEAGLYRGGPTSLGYRAVYKGRLNKKGQPVRDLEIDPEEAVYLKELYLKTLNEGYGSHRLANYLNEMGIKTHTGKRYQSAAVIRILRNPINCGYYHAGSTMSPKIDSLAIIDEELFGEVQKILDQRAEKDKQKRHIAMQTQGKTLLSGNIICGHCGGRMIATQGKDSYVRKDGTLYEKNHLKYICYHRSRRLNSCDGQSVYSASKIDNMVENIVKDYLNRLNDISKDKVIEQRCKVKIHNAKKLFKSLSEEKDKLQNQLNGLLSEVGKCLCGESEFTADMISDSIEATENELNDVYNCLNECERTLSKNSDILKNIEYYYNQCIGWAKDFDNSTLEQKKMIICHLITEIKIKRGYKIEIEFNENYNQFLEE